MEKAKFEYSPFGKIFNKKLKEGDRKEELSKRLKNIEDKNKERLHGMEYQGETKLNMIDKQGKETTRINQKTRKINEKYLKIKMKKKQARKNCWRINCIVKMGYFLIIPWISLIREKMLLRVFQMKNKTIIMSTCFVNLVS